MPAGRRKQQPGRSGQCDSSASRSASPCLGGGGAEATYNQGVILFNAQKFAEAKVQFEAATKADPTMAMAHYQLGMTALNLGDFNTAVALVNGHGNRPRRSRGA